MAGPVKAEPQIASTQKAAKVSTEVERAPVEAPPPMGSVSVLSQPMPPNGGPNKRQALLHLQRTIGNRATGRLLRSLADKSSHPSPNAVQEKLTVGRVDDPCEREADAAASRIESGQSVEGVSRLPDTRSAPSPSLRRQPEEEIEREEEREDNKTEPIQRSCAACDGEEPAQRQVNEDREILQTHSLRRQATAKEDEDLLQTQAVEEEEHQSATTAATQRQTADSEDEEPVQTRAAETQMHLDTDRAADAMARTGGGNPLSPATQVEMERGFATDFSNVRVHTGTAANEAADSINARAFTHGSNIYMGRDASPSDRRLMAHELTHVVQQGFANQDVPNSMVSTKREALSPSSTMSAKDPGSVSKGAKRGAHPNISSVGFPTIVYRYNSWKRHGFRPGTSLSWNKENPSCPWNKEPAIDYIATAPTFGAAVSEPGQLNPISIGGFQEPLSALSKKTGEPAGLPLTATVEKANTAIDQLQIAARQVTSTYNATATAVTSFANAQEGFGAEGEFGPAPSGLNWKAPPEDTNQISVEELAEQQTPHGGTTSMGQVFRSGVADETIEAAKTEQVSKALEKARKSDNHVKDAIEPYNTQLKTTIPKAFRNLSIAYSGLTIQEATEDEEEAKRKKEAFEKEKKDVLKIFTDVNTVITKGGKLLTGDKEAARDLIVFVAEKVLDGVYEADINEQARKVALAKAKIKTASAAIVQLQVSNAEAALNSEVGKLKGLKRTISEKLKDRQDAYDEAAKLAGETARQSGKSKEEANRLRTSIAAIPRIQKVLTRIDGVIRAAAIPSYSSQAGLAYAVAKKTGKGMDTGTFLYAIGMIKTYNQRFQGKRSVWKSRLDKAQAVMGSLNVEGT